MPNQQFVKNTNVPPRDSLLWLVGSNWKISGSTNIPYCPMEDLIDDDLYTTALAEIAKKEIEKREVIQYEIVKMNDEGNQVLESGVFFFYPSDFNGNKKYSLFAFEAQKDAEDKKKTTIRFASYNKQPDNGAQTAPKPTNIAPKAPVDTKRPTVYDTNLPKQTRTTSLNTEIDRQEQNEWVLKQDYIITYTHPTPVKYDDIETQTRLLSEGLNFIPASLCRENTWTELLTVNTETGEQTATRLYLMGRIIRVDIASSNSTNNG